MPRPVRSIFRDTPHHVTQRGNHRQHVFFSGADHLAYLHWMREYATLHEVEVIGYCLMPNHVHLVLVPAMAGSLPRMLQQLHARYARRIHRERDMTGHLWQGRYFASALDGPYFWAVMRYVELNPVRAGMVQRAEDYPWSSAGAHCGQHKDPLLSSDPRWNRQIEGIGDWSAWLKQGCATHELAVIRTNGARCLPCGSDSFIESLEAVAGRHLRERPRGRPRRENGV